MTLSSFNVQNPKLQIFILTTITNQQVEVHFFQPSHSFLENSEFMVVLVQFLSSVEVNFKKYEPLLLEEASQLSRFKFSPPLPHVHTVFNSNLCQIQAVARLSHSQILSTIQIERNIENSDVKKLLKSHQS